MNGQTDAQLLHAYAESRSEAAFNELVRRHVDFVYSAARRMVCDPHLAEDVTQGVFVALAKSAGQLINRPVLSGWLHRTAQNIAAQTVRTIERRRAREQEAAAMNELLSAESEVSWEHIAPHLDAALGELSESDRDALFLRYFERKSARDMAATLGVSDEAAQKRVNRAVERLRELFTKRGVTIGAGALVIVISANAVQAAPIGLAITISAAAALAGTAVAATATASATKAIAMTAFQKTAVTAALTVAVGAGIYEANQVATARARTRTLEGQQAPLADQIQQLQRERDDATNQLAQLNDKIRSAKSNDTELLRLRNEVGTLRNQTNELLRLQAENRQLRADPPSGKAQRPPNLAAGDLVPVESLAFVGYTTPQATFQSTLSAFATRDLKTFFEGFTTELRHQKEEEETGKSEADLAQRAARFAANAVRILDSRQVSDDEARLTVFLTIEQRPVTLTMKRISGEWKISAEKE